MELEPTENQISLIEKLCELWDAGLVGWCEGPDIDEAMRIAGKRPGLWKAWSYSGFCNELKKSPDLLWRLSDGILVTDNSDLKRIDPTRWWYCDGSRAVNYFPDFEELFQPEKEHRCYITLLIKGRFDELEPFFE